MFAPPGPGAHRLQGSRGKLVGGGTSFSRGGGVYVLQPSPGAVCQDIPDPSSSLPKPLSYRGGVLWTERLCPPQMGTLKS